MKYFLDPFGCAKNQVDAEMMMISLNDKGWERTFESAESDLIIVHSCGFIEPAKRESINAVLEWRRQYPNKKILLSGCLAQRYRAELAQSLPEADVLLGSSELESISAGLSAGERPLLGFPGTAYVKISEGCDNRCSFCAIPLIRGNLRCRGIDDIVEECRKLLKRNVRELCLIGQDLASYRPSLSGLLSSIGALKGRFRVRLLYLHPDHFPLDILDIISDDDRFLPYFDIPFQHGDRDILAAMNRKGGAEVYLSLLDTIRSKIPDAVIRSTFLTGFPGETEDHFESLLDFQEKARFDWLGVFCFSREEGTAAWNLKNRVSKKIAAHRKSLIEEKQVPITSEKMDKFIGRDSEVLIEEHIDDEYCLGRLFCHAPDVDGAAVIKTGGAPLQCGELYPCTISARAGFDLEVKIK